ncbi:MAG: hypothetical protein V1774_03820 [Candidatus Eisenbacteria bacterium]
MLRRVFTRVASQAGFVLGLCSVLIGCSDSPPSQPSAGDAAGRVDATIDPHAATFVFESLDSPVPGEAHVRIDLIGRDLRTDPETGQIFLDVAIRNMDRRSLFAPVEIVVSDFVPHSVAPVNADWTQCPDSIAVLSEDCLYGYEYTPLLGDDRTLLPGETSEFRTWQFRVPGLAVFSFGAAARLSLDPEAARIGGLFFHDRNGSGRPDTDEAPLAGGWVRVEGPGIEGRRVRVGPDGRYMIPVRHAGLYTLTATPPPTFQAVHFTTPNPLQVVLAPGSDGAPQSFLDADFGVAWDGPVIPPVRLIDAPADSLPLDSYHLGRIAVDGNRLILEVGFSGCGPDHPFQLFMVGGFMESLPVQARLILSHDDLGELCDAYFTVTLMYDLRPIREAYIEAYGAPGRIILDFVDSRGETHPVVYAIPG